MKHEAIIIAVSAVITFAVIMMLSNQVDKNIDYCTAKGGVLVKSTEGYTCIDKKVVIE